MGQSLAWAAVQKVRDNLNASFPEREEVIDGMLASVLTRNHVLLLGPPGTAKSALVRAVAESFDSTYFEWLLTKFTTPEEFFGPISLKALEQDRYARVTKGKLPEAQIAFIDEVFKGSSSILNTTLTLINERVFHNDGQAVPVPLDSLIGASNEMPEGNETGALWDRFLLRFEVSYLRRPSHFKAMVMAAEPGAAHTLSAQHLGQARAEVAAVKVTPETIEAMANVRDMLMGEGIVASDRRWKQSVRLVQAFAWLEGYNETAAEDLTYLADALWAEPKSRPRVAATLGKVGDPAAHQAQVILDSAREILEGLNKTRADYGVPSLDTAKKSLADFRAQQVTLQRLGETAGPRAKRHVHTASQQVAIMEAELAKALKASLNL